MIKKAEKKDLVILVRMYLWSEDPKITHLEKSAADPLLKLKFKPKFMDLWST